MTYRNWHVGMKVVYVGGSCFLLPRRGIRRLFGKWSTVPTSLKVGSVYEIIFIGMGRNRLTGEKEVGIEIKGDPDRVSLHPARCFRPLQAKKTDISMFTAMLNKRKAREPV
ncbi:MAG: hypothetical protein E5V64_06525 [Mesorhizobium sp.]|uniref:hypothetical protein n=1 Tax=Mesorhizobium sp. TaxID=1871066 RepID=UPI001214C676|nr:hypothetical protein [Mesorhizobium sp.]TIV83815.1 MAG: hypothetical protein E5V64_06525 [Mesorhizobium sp.]